MTIRLVNADDLIERLDVLCDINCHYTKKQRSVMCGSCLLGSAFDVVDDAPTIEPKRKKGKWQGYNADNPDWQRDDGTPIFLVCSECHGTVINNGSAHWNFCPNCGADMRGETNE